MKRYLLVFLVVCLGVELQPLQIHAEDQVLIEECTPKNQNMPLGGHCCEGLIPQKDGEKVVCLEQGGWFDWDDFFMGLAVPFLVFAYIAIFVKRKQKMNN